MSIDSFKLLTYCRGTVLSTGISGAEFTKYDGASITRPRFEYLLNFTSSGTTDVVGKVIADVVPVPRKLSNGFGVQPFLQIGRPQAFLDLLNALTALLDGGDVCPMQLRSQISVGGATIWR